MEGDRRPTGATAAWSRWRCRCRNAIGYRAFSAFGRDRPRHDGRGAGDGRRATRPTCWAPPPMTSVFGWRRARPSTCTRGTGTTRSGFTRSRRTRWTRGPTSVDVSSTSTGRSSRARASSAPCRTWGTGTCGGHWFALDGYRIAAVAEELKPPRLTSCSFATARRSACGSFRSPRTDTSVRQLKQLLVGELDRRAGRRPRPRRPGGRGRDVRRAAACCPPARRSCPSRAARRCSSDRRVHHAERGGSPIGPPLEFERTGDTRSGRRSAHPA